jgi:hypothetical protein
MQNFDEEDCLTVKILKTEKEMGGQCKTSSGLLCSVVGFGVSGIESSCSFSRE